jgi:hypothetical protein
MKCGFLRRNLKYPEEELFEAGPRIGAAGSRGLGLRFRTSFGVVGVSTENPRWQLTGLVSFEGVVSSRAFSSIELEDTGSVSMIYGGAKELL